MVQFAEDEDGHRSSSADSTPDEVDSKLLRKQLLEVSIVSTCLLGFFFVIKFHFPLGCYGNY